MRKIVAFVACSLLAFSLGFTLLPMSFTLLIGWLGPVFGTSIHVLLATIFVLFGDPLKYQSLIGLWITTGFICGLIIRRRLGSVSTASTVFSAMFLVLIVCGIRIFEISEGIGFANLMTAIPPVPPGSSLGTIFSAPIISDVYGLWQKSSPQILQSPTDILSPLVGILVFNLVKNLSLIVFSAFAGCEAGKLVERFLSRRRKRKGGEEKTKADTVASGSVSSLCSPSHLALLLCTIILTVSVVFPAMCRLDNDSYYTEGMFGFTTPDGTTYFASLFVDPGMNFTDMNLSAPEFEGAILGILISQDTGPDRLPPVLTSPSILSGLITTDIPLSLLENLTKFYELVPRTLFFTAYIGDKLNVSRQKADSAASLFSRTFDASLSYLVSFAQEAEIAETKLKIAFFVYQSDAPLSQVSRSIMEYVPVKRNGLASLAYSAYESEIFTPYETGASANGTVMMIGFFSSSTIPNLLETAGFEGLEPLTGILPSSPTPTPMLCMLSYWIGRYHCSRFVHQFSINDLLSNVRPVQSSPEATMSLVLTAAPNATIHEGKMTSVQLIAKIVTSLDLSEPQFKQALEVVQALSQAGFLTFTSVKKGSLISPEDLTVSFVQVLPLNLRVEKAVAVAESDVGQTVDICVKVTNNDDTDAAENVTLDDSFIFKHYSPSSVELVRGSLTRTWSQIAPSSSKMHTYSIILKKEGIYIFPSAEVTYNYMGGTYGAKSTYVYVKVRPPPLPNLLISGAVSAWGVLTRALDRIPGLRGSGTAVLSCVTIAILGVLSFFEYRNFRKWNRKREQKGESSPS